MRKNITNNNNYNYKKIMSQILIQNTCQIDCYYCFVESWHFQTQLLYYICANLAYTDWLYSRWWRRQRMSSLILQLFGQCLLMRHWNWRCRTHFCSLSRSGAGEYCETLLHMSLDLSNKPAEWKSVLLAGSTWRDQYLQF